jgi:putative phage-type endonuclease
MPELTEEQKKFRMSGIGGSDASAICGVNPWSTPYKVYHEKKGTLPKIPLTSDEEDRMHFGSVDEKSIRERWETKESGDHISVIENTLHHPEYDFIYAHIDGLVTYDKALDYNHKEAGSLDTAWKLINGAEYGIEIKCAAREDSWRSGIPIYYKYQVTHYALVTGIMEWKVVVRFYGWKLRHYTIHITKEDIETLLDEELKFWNRIKLNSPPDPTGHQVNIDILTAMSKEIEKPVVTFINRKEKKNKKTIDLVQHICDYKEVVIQEKKLKDAKTEHKTFIENYLVTNKSNKIMSIENETLVSWINTNQKPTVDWKAVADESGYSDSILKRYTKSDGHKRLVFNKVKSEDGSL